MAGNYGRCGFDSAQGLMDLLDQAGRLTDYRHAVENVADPHWRHPIDEIEPEPEPEHSGGPTAAEAVSRVLDVVWGMDRRRRATLTGVHVSIQHAAERLAVLTWILRRELICEGDVSLADLADSLGRTRAHLSQIHVGMKDSLLGFGGAGGRGKSAREASRRARHEVVASGRGAAWGSVKATHDLAGDRDAADLAPALKGLRRLASGHTPGGGDVYHTERRAMTRRGWIGTDDRLTPVGLAALDKMRADDRRCVDAIKRTLDGRTLAPRRTTLKMLTARGWWRGGAVTVEGRKAAGV